ncbi:MAG: hypothetical protein O7G87_17025 [bacterium]|nr:hypothetical protein [bacterium]
MKKLLLTLLLIIGMSLSFAAIGLVMLFALNVVEDLEEVRSLFTGSMPGGESQFLKEEELTKVQDALLLLQQQKGEIERDIQQLEIEQKTIRDENQTLLDTVAVRQERSMVGSEDIVKVREERLSQLVTLYGAMRPADAAAIFDEIPEEENQMILDILTRLQPRLAARILNGLNDEQRKAKLSQELLQGKTAAR